RERFAHARLQHVHGFEPDGHGDVLQDGARGSDEESAVAVGSFRDRARADRATGAGRRPHLRGPDQLSRAHLRRGEEDRLEGRHRRFLAYFPGERASAQGAEIPARGARRVRVLVTGARGMLARALIPELERRGHEVIGLGRDALDVTDADAVERAVREWVPDVVVQCAAYTRVDDAETDEATAFAVNAEGTRNVARACRAVGARLVYPSTD